MQKVKDNLLHAAEVFDTYRVVPRTIIFMACWYVYHFTDMLLFWYTHEPKEGRGIEESTAVTAIIAALAAVLTAAFKFYMDNGRDWTPPPPSTKTTLTTETNQ